MAEKSNIKSQLLVALIAGLCIIAAAIISSPHWFKYFFPEQYIEQEKLNPKKLETEKTSDKAKNKSNETDMRNRTENLVISKIELCPKDFKLPEYFYFEIQNKGTRTIINLNVTVDLGKSSYQDFDYSKSLNIKVIIDSTDKSFLKFFCPIIRQNETISIYVLITQPVFKSILLHADNMRFDKEYSYEEYLESEANFVSELSGFQTFLIYLLSGVMLAFAVYFVSVVITLLNRKFKIGEDSPTPSNPSTPTK